MISVRILRRAADVVALVGQQVSYISHDLANALRAAAEDLENRDAPINPSEPCFSCQDTGITDSGWFAGEFCHCAMGTWRELHQPLIAPLPPGTPMQIRTRRTVSDTIDIDENEGT